MKALIPVFYMIIPSDNTAALFIGTKMPDFVTFIFLFGLLLKNFLMQGL
jgi:hypothetical protein